MEMTDFQFTFSTADDEAMLRMAIQDSEGGIAPVSDALPPGQYRVINGELFRIIEGAPQL